ncbi:hypothetical protein GCM10009557_85600 [Virgisporangium ochraceum]|uniref:DUF2550 family protein n=1 Tax=Virgisporangium ochraceum TaxID=65505 RepID=A0A8J4EFD8_9ACTN|nr:hypothetical protein [Virgisporangium ochraceum]GIJ72611.1 hypothetical protein Voc01_075280 [Virgisporangium ochraceum]
MKPLLIAVAVVLLLGVATVLYVRRRRVVNADGAFRCRVRLTAGRCSEWPRLRHRWSRHRLSARWNGDDLVVRRGPLLLVRVTLRGRIRHAGVHQLSALDVAGLGHRPVSIKLDLPDGSRVEVAAMDLDRTSLVGPYLAAALHDLPRAPRRRRRIWEPDS